MPKINEKEYSILKGLDDKWKWISRDEDGRVWVYNSKPTRREKVWESQEGLLRALNQDLLQFIQWEDSEPYNIAELIEEYESSKEIILHEDFDVENLTLKELDGFKQTLKVIKESEETEVNKMNKEKLKDYLNRVTYAYPELEPESDERPTTEYKRGFNEALELAMAKIDQLDEPEVLSPDWIKDNQLMWTSAHGADYYVPADKLYGQIVPKQEEPEKVVVPDYVAKWIEKFKKKNLDVFIAYNHARIWDVEARQWIMSNPDLFACAWLFGYTVEEKKYYVKEPTTGQFLIKDNQQSNGVKWVDGFSSNPERYTEQEIKDIDERYWEFRKPVEEEE